MRADLPYSAAVFLLFLMSALLHEAGHFLTARFLGIPMKSMRFLTAGALMTFDFHRTTYIREAAVHLGGTIFAVCASFLSYIIVGDSACVFLGITAVLSAVNLIPVKGTDGSAALKAVLLNFFLPDTAERIVIVVSWISWSVLWCAVMWTELRVRANLSLMLFVLGLFFGNILADKKSAA